MNGHVPLNTNDSRSAIGIAASRSCAVPFAAAAFLRNAFQETLQLRFGRKPFQMLARFQMRRGGRWLGGKATWCITRNERQCAKQSRKCGDDRKCGNRFHEGAECWWRSEFSTSRQDRREWTVVTRRVWLQTAPRCNRTARRRSRRQQGECVTVRDDSGKKP